MFLIPCVTIIVLFAVLWWADLLPRLQVVGGFIVVGLAGQSLSSSLLSSLGGGTSHQRLYSHLPDHPIEVGLVDRC